MNFERKTWSFSLQFSASRKIWKIAVFLRFFKTAEVKGIDDFLEIVYTLYLSSFGFFPGFLGKYTGFLPKIREFPGFWAKMTLFRVIFALFLGQNGFAQEVLGKFPVKTGNFPKISRILKNPGNFSQKSEKNLGIFRKSCEKFRIFRFREKSVFGPPVLKNRRLTIFKKFWWIFWKWLDEFFAKRKITEVKVIFEDELRKSIFKNSLNFWKLFRKFKEFSKLQIRSRAEGKSRRTF